MKRFYSVLILIILLSSLVPAQSRNRAPARRTTKQSKAKPEDRVLVNFGDPPVQQEPSLWLAGVEMRLGMAQEEIMARVPERYTVQLITGSKSQYLIRSRQRNDDNEYEFYGTILFKDGRLFRASKDWYNNNGGSDYKLADTLYFVIADVEKRSESLVGIRTANARQLEYSSEDVILTFTRREVTISATEYKGVKGVQITEVIMSRPRP